MRELDIPSDVIRDHAKTRARVQHRLRSVYSWTRPSTLCAKLPLETLRRWPFVWLRLDVAGAGMVGAERVTTIAETATITDPDLQQSVTATVRAWFAAPENAPDEDALEEIVINVLDAAIDEQDRRRAAMA